MSIIAELKRRNVFRVGLFYVVSAWLLVQVAETLLPLFEVPEGVLRGLVVLLAMGFLPALVFAWVYELTPEGLRRDAGARPDQATGPVSRKLDVATIAVALLAIALLVIDRVIPTGVQPGSPGSLAGPESAKTEPAVHDASIAVLPFADLSPEGDQAYFSDGMAEEILNALVRVDALEVASRTSSFAFKGRRTWASPPLPAHSACGTCWRAVCDEPGIPSASRRSSSTQRSIGTCGRRPTTAL